MTLEEANRMMQEFMMKFMKLNQDVIQMLMEATVPNRGSLEKKIICQPCPTKNRKKFVRYLDRRGKNVGFHLSRRRASQFKIP